ncbi:hypothetical protein BKA70DRAFT_1223682 [Coprinopsis sp. MPI-PUGE-AT-0042]|nr:hypothetical protein BKA70DRAFT_1223682 [Coprinopsis sp. MPI-PUGE-AT-0042]
MSMSPLQTRHHNAPVSTYGGGHLSNKENNDSAGYRSGPPTSIPRNKFGKETANTHERARPASPISIKSNFPNRRLSSNSYDDLVEEEMTFTIYMGDRKASVVITGPLSPRVPCCGQTFPSDVSFLSTDTGSIKTLAKSLNKPTSQDGFTQKLNHMAVRGQSSRVSMDLARLQLKLALATYMDRVDDFETEHTLIHQTLHEISLPSVAPLWHEANWKIEEMAMRRLPQVAESVGDNLALLRPYTEHLRAVQSLEDLQDLEARVDQIFELCYAASSYSSMCYQVLLRTFWAIYQD